MTLRQSGCTRPQSLHLDNKLWMRRFFSPHPRSRRLLVAGSVCWIISGLDLREPLHASRVDFGDAVLERGARNLILDLAIPQGSFKGDELPLLEGPGELREIPPGIDAVPLGAGSVGRVATLALRVFFMVVLLSLGSGFCLCRNGIAASICRTPPGEGGGSKVQGEGSPHPWRAGTAGTERAKRSGGLHKRSAEDWGSPCGARSGQSPLAGLFSLALRAAHELLSGRCGVSPQRGWRKCRDPLNE
jgi:hypothetical protein